MTNAEAIKWLELQRSVGIQWDDDSEMHRPIREEAEKRISEAYSMAIDALREQEPRVLMLEDVHRDHDRVLWIECDDSKTQNIGQYRGQVYWHDRRVGKWERFVTIGFANDYLHRESEKYGKTWRCWTSRPTEEQRRKEAWDA